MPLIFSKNLGQRHVNILKWPKSKAVEIVEDSGNCQFFPNIKQVTILFISELRFWELKVLSLAELCQAFPVIESVNACKKFEYLCFCSLGQSYDL